MISGSPVESVHSRAEPTGSERYAPGGLGDPLSAARSDPPDRESHDRRSETSDREERPAGRGSGRSGGGDRAPIEIETEDPADEIRRLEAEIERKDQHLRHVVDRYERLLAERDRKLAEERSASTGGAWSAVRSTVASFFRGDE